MAAFGLTSDYTNILTAGISSWEIKSGKSGETGAVELAPLADGVVTVKSYSVLDSRRKPYPYAVGIEATAKILGTAKAGCLQKLNLLTGYMNGHQITAINGETYTANLGTYWKFVCDGNIDTNRYIEIRCDGAMIAPTLLDAFISQSAYSASNSADYLYGFAPGTIYPAGCQYVYLRNAGETAWESVGVYRNPSLVAELKCVKDDAGRSIGYAVQVDVGFDWLQTDEEAHLLDTIMASTSDFKMTLQEGTIFAFADNMGLNFSWENKSDMDDVAYIRVTGSGCLTPAEFVACIS